MAINHEEIKIQAKQILDKFADALKSVDKEIKEDSYVDREEFERVEGESISKSKDSEASKNAEQSPVTKTKNKSKETKKDTLTNNYGRGK